jgi:hypothetical protein
MLVKLDGTVVTSLPDAYCDERLLTPEETDKTIEFLNQEKRRTTAMNASAAELPLKPPPQTKPQPEVVSGQETKTGGGQAGCSWFLAEPAAIPHARL